MQEIIVQGQSGRSRILIGETLANLNRYLPDGRAIIITDENVARLYADQFPPVEVITIGSGETHKTMETLAQIFDRLIAAEADRSAFIVGIGGGIVGDVTGFAASTYMRGVRFGFVASTLLAQVDATVGGKNGVNFKGYKNMVGVFCQPEFVIIDIAMLKTLPPAEIACGLAEIVKHACIADAVYFDDIETHCDRIAALDATTMLRLVQRSVEIKAAVVNADERESGERRKLNFGHTLGHAFEKTLGISHGAAVSAGMVLASELSVRQGLLSPEEFERIKKLLSRLHLPTELEFDRAAVFDALKKDKKRQRAQMHFVLLTGIGRSEVRSIAIEEIGAWLMGR
ncbi:MAG: 3-dehydroquinate synthase [Desulfobacteraceae bacterium]|nr:3-dehydroquinate synthase [Desulfobacteraceae bacterium]